MIEVFIHISCMNDHWVDIVSEITDSIHQSGLYDRANRITFGIIGSGEDMAQLQLRYKHWQKANWIYHGTDFKQYEFPTLEALSASCRYNPEANILYCHTKGVSKNYKNPYWKYWRRYMINSCITEHEKHIGALANHDISGNMWTGNNHYSGNFWWANANYINTLPEINSLKNNPVTVWSGHSTSENLRLQCEMWLGMRTGIRLMDFGKLNMKQGFAFNIFGESEKFPCPLNDMGFDRIYLINMDDRPDRYAQAIAGVNNINLANVIRFPAINARQLGITKKTLDNPGLIGCFMSHFFILQEAVINNYKRILVFEDDVTFVNGFNEILSYSLEQLPSDWQLVYLGYTERNGMFSYKKQVSENIVIPNDPWGTQAYMLQGDGIKILYDNLREIKEHIDVQMSRDICPKLNAYEIFPSLCPQSGSDSDISIGSVSFNIVGRNRWRKPILN